MELVTFKPYKWLDTAKIFNKNNEQIDTEWIENNADIIILLFTADNIDKDGIVYKFYEIYENVKFLNMPIEVIYIPMDETEEGAANCYEKQANWFTLKFSDPLVQVLKYLYGISAIPHLLVLKPDGSIVSRHAITDLEQHGKNAVISWLTCGSPSKYRNFNAELSMYGPVWCYMNVEPKKKIKPEYHRKFSVNPLSEEKKTLSKTSNRD